MTPRPRIPGLCLALFLSCMAFPTSAALGQVSGSARVIDGDTLEIAGERLRLHGIDAPESRQTCAREGVIWLCGSQATKTLRDLIGSSTVTCDDQGRDRWGRLISVCHVGATNLNAAMVSAGMALAYQRYSKRFLPREAEAKAARRGMWAGRFVEPWRWRRGARLTSRAANDDRPARARDCRIKGNISRNGKIYHVPGGRYYSRTKIGPSKSERWFCTEGEAQAAGWRRSKR